MTRAFDPAANDRTAATETAIDWNVPIDDSAFHLPPEYLSLFGTPIWVAMPDARRKEYSRHEAAAGYRSGIWFENILVHNLMRHLYDLPSDDPLRRFLHLEAAQECRHSAMFGEFIRRSGTPDYTPTPRLLFMGKLLKSTETHFIYCLATLAGEELADAYNRATSESPEVHPTSKRMALLHRADEASHIAFIRDSISRQWTALGAAHRAYVRLYAPILIYTLVDSMVHPEVFRALGIEDGYRVAWSNPRRRERVVSDLKPLTDFLARLGLIPPSLTAIWRSLGLVD